MTQECSDDSDESDRNRSFLCFFGLHKWKRKSGALYFLPTVMGKRYECVYCGKHKMTFEKENNSYTISAGRSN